MVSLLPSSVHRIIYVTGLAFLSLGIIYSCPVMSMSIMLLGANWFMELNYRARIQLFLQNPAALILSAVFFMHLLGLFWTTDIKYGIDDVRTKIPLFVLPFIISTTPRLSKKHLHLILALFITGVTVTTLISMSILKGLLPITVHDIRDISPFVSHIRLSLMICLCIVILGSYIVEKKSLLFRIACSLLIFWLIVFMAVLESLTGLSILAVVSLVLGLAYFSSHKPRLGRPVLAVIAIVLAIASFHVYSISQTFVPKISIHSLVPEKYTPSGHLYNNDTTFPVVENGSFVYFGVCYEELKTGWEQRSKRPFYENDLKGNSICQTLLRYMASKGILKKNSETIASLSQEDIQNVENGVTNYKYRNVSSLNARIYEAIWEIDVYTKGSNASGHSITMRFEFWRAGLHILKKNLFWGIGTGDVKQAFQDQYIIDHSKLDERWRLRGHNQYLAIAIAFGLVGLLAFLVSLVFPLLYKNMYRDLTYLAFWIILAVSFLTEDTLETQAGVTFYALFNALFLFAQPETSETKSSQKIVAD
jgi:hypothetical protein